MRERQTFKTMIISLCAVVALPSIGRASETLIVQDTFTRPGSTDINKNIPMGRRGSLKSIAWKTMDPDHELQSMIKANSLFLSKDDQTRAISLDHNFVDPSIRDMGGFTIEANLAALNDKIPDRLQEGIEFDPSNKYYGFGIGISSHELQQWSDFKSIGSFRGVMAGAGSCDFWIGFANRTAPELQVRSNGLTLEAIPLTKCRGMLKVTFLLVDGFRADDQVEIYATLDGQRLDLNSSAPQNYRVIKWKDDNANIIGLEARSTDGAEFQDFKVSLLEKKMKTQTPHRKKTAEEIAEASKKVATGLFVLSPILLLLFRKNED